MFETSERDRLTEEHMSDPQIGDRFSEMCSFWVYIVYRNGQEVGYMEANPPCTFPDDGKFTLSTVREFKKRFGYESIPGYWVTFCDSGNNVDGWVETTVRKATLVKP